MGKMGRTPTRRCRKCSKCDKVIRYWNKSGLCDSCGMRKVARDRWDKIKAKGQKERKEKKEANTKKELEQMYDDTLDERSYE